MSDPRITKMARLLVSYCVSVQPGDRVVVQAGTAAAPLIEEIYGAVLRAGGHPFLLWDDDIFTEILFAEGSEEQIRHVPEPLKLVTENYECRIRILSATNTRAMSGVELAKQKVRREAVGGLQATVMRRSAAGELRWVGAIYPTNGYAQEAEMSLRDYENFVYGACYVDQVDPVAAWQEVSVRQQRLVDWLVGKEEVLVQGPNVELRLSIAGRTFINSDGHRNMPSGEIFTGPVEESVTGWVRCTYPAIYAGREVEDVELRFVDGQVVDARAAKNQEFLVSVLDTDAGARYLGEFAIGTNDGIDRFTKSILFDEKIGGTIHVAVGAGYPETGSRNRSAVHWDMICDMRAGGKIWVDGELFYDSGRFLLP